METIRFYDELPPMECFAGDTLPVFEITADATGTMVLYVEEQSTAGSVRLAKACAVSGDTFTVQLTSEDTAVLGGDNRMHFVLTDGDGKRYEKLVGTLTVKSTAGGRT